MRIDELIHNAIFAHDEYIQQSNKIFGNWASLLQLPVLESRLQSLAKAGGRQVAGVIGGEYSELKQGCFN